MPTIRGNCLCCASIFNVTLEHELESVYICSCTYCQQHLPQWAFVSSEAVVFERKSTVNDYEGHEFCAACGTMMLAKHDVNGITAVNVRTLQEVEPRTLKESPCGLPTEESPLLMPSCTNQQINTLANKQHFLHAPNDVVFPRPLTAPQIAYRGSCPCGAVRIAMQAPPLTQVMVNECNCSHCWRNACVFAYPPDMKPKACVMVQGALNLAAFPGMPVRPDGDGFQFCKRCGLWLFVSSALTSDEQVIQKIGSDTAWVELSVMAINLHALEDVPWHQLKVNKYDGRTKNSIRDYVVA